MIKCPVCNEDLKEVNVVSHCYQRSLVDENGKITQYGQAEVTADTISIECALCGADVTDLIKE